MSEPPVVEKDGFTPVQGCLLAAVILFILLFGVTITLSYRQFRENTGQPSEPTVERDAAHLYPERLPPSPLSFA